jgi:hypothetical protein
MFELHVGGGGLTERNRPKTKTISDPLELYRLLATPGHTVVYAPTEDEEDKKELSRTTSTQEGQPKAKKSNTHKLQKKFC